MSHRPSNYWGDGSFYGDGDLWNGESFVIHEYLATQETPCHRLSLKITKTGATKFLIHRLVARLSRTRRDGFTHMGYVDKVTPSRFISLSFTHAGSLFVLSATRVIASRKNHQPRG